MSQPVDTGGEDPSDESSSALHVKESELVALKRAFDAQNQELHETREKLRETQETLDNEKRRWQQQGDELSEAKATLEKEKRKVRRIWREKCELQLSHEDVIDAKDVEIARLKVRLLAVVSSHTSILPIRVWAIFISPYAYGLPIQVSRDTIGSPILLISFPFEHSVRDSAPRQASI